MAETSKEIILDKAREIFIQKGFAGARMQEIADAAGINKAMLHYYYKTKKELFLVVFQEVLAGMMSGLSAALEGEGSVMDKLRKAVTVYISRLQAHPHVPLFILHEISQNRLDFLELFKDKFGHFPNFQKFFLQIMQEQAAGTINAIPPMHLLLNVISMSVFPFLVKPVFCNLMNIPETQYQSLILNDRAEVVIQFLENALKP
ncbi:MAG: TetR/AcrR family transcriptional regulator [Bacteroidota bacterium]